MVKIVYAFFYAISLLPFRLLYCIADFEYFMMYRVIKYAHDALEPFDGTVVTILPYTCYLVWIVLTKDMVYRHINGKHQYKWMPVCASCRKYSFTVILLIEV